MESVVIPNIAAFTLAVDVSIPNCQRRAQKLRSNAYELYIG